MTSLAWAQPSLTQAGPLIGSPATTNACQGVSVALSSDGLTAVVGGPGDSGGSGTLGDECGGGAGAAFVYIRVLGQWQQQAKLVGAGATGAANQGYSVALSGDGNTAAVGGPTDNASVGAVWFFTRTGTTWTQQGGKIVGTSNLGASLQGRSISLSADGNTAVVGGPGDNFNVGAIWIFTRSGGVWTQVTKLIGSGGSGSSFQGSSVSVSGDGNTAVEGGPFDNSQRGAAWVFVQSPPGTWTQQGAKIVPAGIFPNTYFGISGSVSANGNDAIWGGFGDLGNLGAAWVYTRSGVTWTVQQKLTGSSFVIPSAQGTSVAISGDGNMAVIGGNRDNGEQGAVWVFTRSGVTWTQSGAKYVGTGNIGTARQGTSVAVASVSKDTLIEGGYFNKSDPGSPTSDVGAAWIFGPATALLTTSTTVTSSPNPSVPGQTVTLTGTVTNISGVPGTPTGLIRYLVDGGAVFPPLDFPIGVLVVLNGLTSGSHSIVATYLGDGTFAGSSGTLTQIVLGSQTINVTTHAPATAEFGTSFTVAANASSGLPVTITASGSCSGSGTGSATITITSPTGTCTITYSQAGNTTFAPATVIETTTATKATTTLSTPVGAGILVVGQTITISTTLAIPGTGTPTGTITFTNGATVIGTVPVNGAGTYTINYVLVSTTGTIVATYSGDANFNAATSPPFNLANVKLPTTTTLSGPTSAQVNQTLIYTATVALAAGSGVTPGGTVSFTINSSPVAGCQSVTLNASNAASCSITFSSSNSGNQTVTGTYSGDVNTTGSSGSLTVSVAGGPESAPQLTLTVTSDSPSPTVGQPITFTATITGGGTIQGTVQIFEGTTLLGSGVVRNGVATITVTGLSSGSHNLLAVFNNANGPNVSTVFGQYVYGLPAKLALTVAPSPSVFGQAVTFTVGLTFNTPPAGISPPTGTISFFDGTTLLGTINIGTGTLTFQTSQLAAGTHQLTAVYSGDSSWNSAVSNIVVFTVNAAATTTSPSAVPDFSVAAPQVTLTAKVTPVAPGGGVPTGTVQFVDMQSGAVLATAPLDAGTATAKIALTLTGARTIQATYSGSPNYQGSSGTGPLIQLVNGASYTSTSRAVDEIATIFGSSLADSTAPAMSLPLPDKLGGSTVTVKDSAGVDHPALLFYASPNQINFLVPANIGTGTVTVTVTTSGGRTFSLITRFAPVVPGLFSAGATGRGVAAAQIVRVAADGTQTSTNAATISSDGSVQAVPIDLSDTTSRFYVVLYGTGLRAGRNTTVTINGISVPVLYSGLQSSFAGLDQVNLGPLPASLRGAGSVDVQIMVDGLPSNTVMLTFR